MKRSYLIYFQCAVLTLALTSCGKKDVVEEVLRPVRYEQVQLNSGEVKRSFSGTASAGINSKLSFRVGGTLIKRVVDVGDRVKKGDLIAELDATDYVIQKQEAQASFVQAQAKVRNSKANYDRTKALYENDNTSKSDLDSARATQDSDKAALGAFKQKLDLAHLQIEYTKLLAPMDGVVGGIQAQVNENINAGESIVRIESEGDIKVVVGVPESFISRINTKTQVSVRFSSLGSKIFKAFVTEVSYSLGDASTYPVSVVLTESSKDIRPGMVAEIFFQMPRSQGNTKRLIVSSSCVAADSSGKFVFVLTSAGENVGIVHRRSVEVYGLTDQGFEIKNGLVDGDLVVSAGVSKLTDGMKVKYIQ